VPRDKLRGFGIAFECSYAVLLCEFCTAILARMTSCDIYSVDKFVVHQTADDRFAHNAATDESQTCIIYSHYVDYQSFSSYAQTRFRAAMIQFV
jgi:hypothetical protein